MGVRLTHSYISKVIAVLNSIEEITKSISTDAASGSLIIIRGLRRTLEIHDNDRGVRTMKGDMLTSLLHPKMQLKGPT